MKALKMTKWHSLAMAAALCCGTFSGTSHAADADPYAYADTAEHREGIAAF